MSSSVDAALMACSSMAAVGRAVGAAERGGLAEHDGLRFACAMPGRADIGFARDCGGVRSQPFAKGREVELLEGPACSWLALERFLVGGEMM